MQKFLAVIGGVVVVIGLFACAIFGMWAYNAFVGVNQVPGRLDVFVATLEAGQPVQNSVVIQPQPTAVILNLIPEQPTAVTPAEDAPAIVEPQEPETVINWQAVLEATAVPSRQLTPEQEAACALAKEENRRQAPYCVDAKGVGR